MAIAQVNSNAAVGGGSAGTIAAPATSLTSGNLQIVGVSAASGSGSVTGIADTAGNTYTKAVSLATNPFTELWYTHATAGNGSNVITATYSGSFTNRSICIAQYSGATGYLPRFLTAWGTGATTSVSLQIAYTLTDGLAIAVARNGSGSAFTAGSGFTTVVSDGSNLMFIEEAIVTASTTLTPAATTAGSTNKDMVCAFFQPAPATGGAGGGGAFFG